MRKLGFWLKAPLLLVAVQGGGALAQRSIDLPGDKLFPESMATDGKGTAYVSRTEGGILKVTLASGKIEQWIAPGAFGSSSIFGIFVDPVNKLIWACSNDLTAQGYGIAGADKGASRLKGFDMATGQGKVSLTLTAQGAFCNDITVAKDGTLYVADSGTSHVLRWKPGATALEDWFFDPRFFHKDGGGLDGIAVGGDGHLYMNNWRSAEMARVTVKADGSAGGMTLLDTSRPLLVPDGLRLVDGLVFAQAEGGGKISLATIKGDKVEVTTLTEGLSSPTAVGLDGKAVWYVQGEMSYVFNPTKRTQKPPLPFRLASVKLP